MQRTHYHRKNLVKMSFSSVNNFCQTNTPLHAMNDMALTFESIFRPFLPISLSIIACLRSLSVSSILPKLAAAFVVYTPRLRDSGSRTPV